MIRLPYALGLCFLLPQISFGVIALSTSTTDWTAVQYPNGVQSDYLADQQTGQPEADIVGTLDLNTQPGFYRQYEDVGNDGLIANDEIAFRVRLGGDTNSVGLDTTVLVGISFFQPNSPSIDLFIGVGKGPGNKTFLNFYDPGDLANTSPDTTSVNDYSGPLGSLLTWQRSEDDSDFDDYFTFLSVDGNTDQYIADGGDGADNDIGDTGGTDIFVSFRVEMMNIIAAAADLNDGFSVDENTAMSYVVLTSNQDNAFNQDLGGHNRLVDGTFDKSSETWASLGGVSSPYLGDSETPVPEPAAFAMLSGLLALFLVAGRRRC